MKGDAAEAQDDEKRDDDVDDLMDKACDGDAAAVGEDGDEQQTINEPQGRKDEDPGDGSCEPINDRVIDAVMKLPRLKAEDAEIKCERHKDQDQRTSDFETSGEVAENEKDEGANKNDGGGGAGCAYDLVGVGYPDGVIKRGSGRGRGCGRGGRDGCGDELSKGGQHA